MRFRRLGVVVAGVLVAGSANLAVASPTPTDGHSRLVQRWPSRPWLSLLDRGQPVTAGGLVRAWRRGIVTASTSATLTATAAPQPALLPLGNLDGDGRGDVVELRGNSSHTRVGLLARDGMTGRLLWQRVDSVGSNGYEFPLPTLWNRPVAGVLLVVASTHASGSNTQVVDLRLSGLASANGHTLWTHLYTGRITQTSSGLIGSNVPSFDPFFDSRGRLHDLLVSEQSFQFGQDAFGNPTQSGSVTPLGVSVLTGQQRALGSAVSSGDSVPTAQAVGDLNGDGFADLILVVPGSSSSLTARNGTDGSQLWQSTSVPMTQGAFAVDVGPVTHDHSDIGLFTGPPSSSGAGGLPTAIILGGGQGGSVDLISGTNGATVWSKTGDFAIPLGDTATQVPVGVGVVTFTNSSTSSATSDTATVAAYTASGTALYSRSYTASASPPSSNGFSAELNGISTVGDVQPDGVSDLFLEMDVTTNTGHGRFQALLNGATGSILRRGDPGTPLYVALTGHGDDFATATALPGGKGIAIRATRGSTGARLWQHGLPGSRGLPPGFVLGGPDPTNTCGGILVSAQTSSTGYDGLLAASGGLRWYVRYHTGDLTAGVLTRAATVPRNCAS